MNRTKKITLKHKAKNKKAKPRNGNKPVYVAKADRVTDASRIESPCVELESADIESQG